LRDPVPTIIARREARQKLNARVPLQGTTTSTSTTTTTTTTAAETTKKVSRAPRRSEPQNKSSRPLAIAGAPSAKKVSRAPKRSEPPSKSSRPLAVAGALSAKRSRSLLQSDSPYNIVEADIKRENLIMPDRTRPAGTFPPGSVCAEQTRASLKGATFYNNSCADCVDRRNTRRVLHSEGQGIPVSLEPRKKSLRPFTSVGALGASFVLLTTALDQKIRSVVKPRSDATLILSKFCQPRVRAIIDYVGKGSGGVTARGCFGSISS
jgi:hypothetical protein